MLFLETLNMLWFYHDISISIFISIFIIILLIVMFSLAQRSIVSRPLKLALVIFLFSGQIWSQQSGVGLILWFQNLKLPPPRLLFVKFFRLTSSESNTPSPSKSFSHFLQINTFSQVWRNHFHLKIILAQFTYMPLPSFPWLPSNWSLFGKIILYNHLIQLFARIIWHNYDTLKHNHLTQL